MFIQQMNVNFYKDSAVKLNYQPIFLCGPARSGKSSLGRLLGSFQNHFHTEEEWSLIAIPQMVQAGFLSKKNAQNFLSSRIKEMAYDSFLMRSMSFRPADQSYIYNTKTKDEVKRYTHNLKSRKDVLKYANKSKPTLIFNMSQYSTYLDILLSCNPKAKIIYMVRNPFSIALDVYAKGWYSDISLKKPSNNIIYKGFKIGRTSYHVPIWLKSADAIKFIESSEKDRALFYAIKQYEYASEHLKKIPKSKYKIVFYEDLISDPNRVISSILDKKSKKGLKTKGLISVVKSRSKMPANSFYESKKIELSNATIKKLNEYYPRFGKRYLKTESK